MIWSLNAWVFQRHRLDLRVIEPVLLFVRAFCQCWYGPSLLSSWFIDLLGKFNFRLYIHLQKPSVISTWQQRRCEEYGRCKYDMARLPRRMQFDAVLGLLPSEIHRYNSGTEWRTWWADTRPSGCVWRDLSYILYYAGRKYTVQDTLKPTFAIQEVSWLFRLHCTKHELHDEIVVDILYKVHRNEVTVCAYVSSTHQALHWEYYHVYARNGWVGIISLKGHRCWVV